MNLEDVVSDYSTDTTESGTAACPYTILAANVFEEDLDFQPSQSWRKPFEQLLILLRIITSSGAKAEIKKQYFCFQHTHDLSELTTVFLYVSISSGIAYKVDIASIRFGDSDSESHSGQAFVAELAEYAIRVLSRVQEYSDRLIENDIIYDTSPFTHVDLFTCPLCHSPLQSCCECDETVACSNNHCAGSEVAYSVQCEEHERMACHGCLDSKGTEPNSPFVQCPSCKSWCCSLEVAWCPGRIIHPELDGRAPAELPDSSRPVVRSHLPTPGPCRSCIESGHVAAWQACSLGRSDLCPSNSKLSEDYLNYAYCPECVTEFEGRRCACGAVWFCDVCPVGDPVFPCYPKLISCPRCGGTYCRNEDGCRYCYFCQTCLKTGLCFGCQALEKGDFATPGECSQPINDFEACVDCQYDICNECCSTANLGVMQCSGCHRWMCGDCSGWKRCHSCLGS